MKPLRILFLLSCLLPFGLMAAKIGEMVPAGGQEIKVTGGITLRLLIEEGQFRLYQVDEKGKAIKPTIGRANMRVEEQRAKNMSTFLNLAPLGDDAAWGNERKFTPPHRYWIILNIWTEGAEAPQTERFLIQ